MFKGTVAPAPPFLQHVKEEPPPEQPGPVSTGPGRGAAETGRPEPGRVKRGNTGRREDLQKPGRCDVSTTWT